MEQPLAGFVRALRGAGAAVSTAESIDAARALELIGYGERQTLKDALSVVLAKSPEEKDIHDRLFDLFFSSALSSDENNEIDKSSGDERTGGIQSSDAFMELAASGNADAVAMAIQLAATEVGADNIQFSTQASFLTRRILERLGVREMEERLIRHLQAGSAEDDAVADTMMQARATLQGMARQHVDQRFEIFGRAATETFMDDVVQNRPLGALDQRDMERMKLIVARVAKRLAVRHARRRRKKSRGRLDASRTIRQNAGLGGVPFHLVWKHKRRDRPKIVAVCDVSGSVARYVRFLLMFLYALREEVVDLSAFAFSARLADVGDWLDDMDFNTAMNTIVDRIGSGSTDYGQALLDLREIDWDAIDRRTTVLILGDGRSNHSDPQLDVFRELSAKCRRVVWLCPEPEGLWGSGDSVMLEYRPHCSRVAHCATAADIEREIDAVLMSYD